MPDDQRYYNDLAMRENERVFLDPDSARGCDDPDEDDDDSFDYGDWDDDYEDEEDDDE